MAGQYDLLIEQGETFALSFVWTNNSDAPFDLSGCSAVARLYRKNAPSPSLELTSGGGDIVITPLDGRLDLTITDEATGALVEVKDGFWRLDLLFPGGTDRALVKGALNVIARNGANA